LTTKTLEAKAISLTTLSTLRNLKSGAEHDEFTRQRTERRKFQRGRFSSSKLIKAPRGSGFYLLEIPHNSRRSVPRPDVKPSVPIRWIREAARKVAKERKELLIQS
jgi:hypothetical protein